ncbi:hypothetical protein MPTK2_5g90120P [Marchantia polymorpha subsp. ruderalis]
MAKEILLCGVRE